MLESPPICPTVGEIARRLNVPIHRIEYVIRARRICAAGKAGNAYIYSDADVDRIASELRRLERDRAEVGVSHVA
jgi:DNA-binding transcriptional MerR regulator